jgi:hypothetical protein
MQIQGPSGPPKIFVLTRNLKGARPTGGVEIGENKIPGEDSVESTGVDSGAVRKAEQEIEGRPSTGFWRRSSFAHVKP